MVDTILKQIGEDVKTNVTFLSEVFAPARRIAHNGVVYVNEGQEKKIVTINDQMGRTVYIRQMSPEQASELPQKTSCYKEYEIRAKCRLVYFNFSNYNLSEDKIKSILASELNKVNYRSIGTSKRIRVLNNTYSTDFERIFQEETTKPYDGDIFPTIIAIDFTLIYEDKNCEVCDIEQEEC